LSIIDRWVLFTIIDSMLPCHREQELFGVKALHLAALARDPKTAAQPVA
jgi:hypothetical protein